MPAFLRKIFFWEFMIMSLILFGSLNRCNVDQWEHSNKLKVKQTVCIVLTAEISTFWLDYCNGSWQRITESTYQSFETIFAFRIIFY